jgi:hypothetical protein
MVHSRRRTAALAPLRRNRRPIGKADNHSKVVGASTGGRKLGPSAHLSGPPPGPDCWRHNHNFKGDNVLGDCRWNGNSGVRLPLNSQSLARIRSATFWASMRSTLMLTSAAS